MSRTLETHLSTIGGSQASRLSKLQTVSALGPTRPHWERSHMAVEAHLGGAKLLPSKRCVSFQPPHHLLSCRKACCGCCLCCVIILWLRDLHARFPTPHAGEERKQLAPPFAHPVFLCIARKDFPATESTTVYHDSDVGTGRSRLATQRSTVRKGSSSPLKSAFWSFGHASKSRPLEPFQHLSRELPSS